MPRLPPRDLHVLRVVYGDWRTTGVPPTHQEIHYALGLPMWQITYSLWRLRARGLLRGSYGQARNNVPTPAGVLAAQGYELIYTC